MTKINKTGEELVLDFGSSNLYTIVLIKILSANNQLIADGFLPSDVDQSRVTVELPKDLSHGDLASNNAIVLAQGSNKSPREIATANARILSADSFFSQVSVAGPGFQNFTISHSALTKFLAVAIKDGSDYGRSRI